MQNIMMTLQYNGTQYLGWTRPEKDGYNKTISYKINTVLTKITGQPVSVYAGARTDPGVHAYAQCISFFTDSSFSPEELLTLANRFLPADIKITAAQTVPERFRADLNALKQTYECRVCTAPVYDIFTSAYTEHIFPGPDIALMKEAAQLFIGTHDFRCFSKTRGRKKTEKTIEEICFTHPDSAQDTLIISITANDFLCQMPAAITAALLEIGTGRRKTDSIRSVFSGNKNSFQATPETWASFHHRHKETGVLSGTKGLLLKNITYKTNHSVFLHS